MQYRYMAYGTSGDAISGVLEADSMERAEQMLWQRDLTIINLKQKRDLPSLTEVVPSLFGVKRADVIAFSRDLSTLLGSGISLLPALGILYEQIRKSGFKKIIINMIQALETGSSFSETCASHPTVFSPLYLRMIRLGEEVGNLSSVLEQLRSYMEKDEAVSRRIKGAMAYPAFILGVAVVAVIILVTFVLPAMSGLFGEFGEDMPALTMIMVGIAEFFGNTIWYWVGGLAVVGIFWYVYCRRTEGGKRKWDGFMMRVPVLKDITIRTNMSGICRSMGTLLGSGVPLSETLGLIIQTTENAAIKETVMGLHSDVQTGRSLSEAMASRSMFPVLMSQMVGVGEETGRLEQNLETLAGFYEEEADRAISRLTGLIGPALIIGVGLIVAFIAVSIFGSIYSVVGVIQ